MNRSTLYAGDSQGDPPVMDLVVGVLLEQGVGDLGQAEPLLPVHDEGNDAHAVEVDRADLLGRSDAVCFRFLEGILIDEGSPGLASFRALALCSNFDLRSFPKGNYFSWECVTHFHAWDSKRN